MDRFSIGIYGWRGCMCLDGSRSVIYVQHGNVKGYIGAVKCKV